VNLEFTMSTEKSNDTPKDSDTAPTSLDDIPQIEETPDPTETVETSNLGKITFAEPEGKKFHCKLQVNANVPQIIAYLNSIFTITCYESDDQYKMLKGWGWEMTEVKKPSS